MNWRYLPWVFFPDRQRAQLVRDLPFEVPSLFSGQFYPEGKGTGNCGPAASVRAAPPERHSTGRIAGPHRTPTSPRYSHATRTPARPVGLPWPPGSGQKGVGAGVTTPPYQRPRAAGAFDSFVPERWGPRLRWAAASRHSTPPGRPSRTMVTYSIVRSGLVVELSEPLLKRRRRPHAHPAHASSRSSRHDATLPVAGFSRPQALG